MDLCVPLILVKEHNLFSTYVCLSEFALDSPHLAAFKARGQGPGPSAAKVVGGQRTGAAGDTSLAASGQSDPYLSHRGPWSLEIKEPQDKVAHIYPIEARGALKSKR